MNLRVFGGKTVGNTVPNADGCTMQHNEISPLSLNDFANPQITAKVNSPTTRPSTPTKRCNVPSSSFETRRASWWTGWRTMLSRVETTLRRRRSNFTKLACMRRRRERSAQNSISHITSFCCMINRQNHLK
jgi:hypothetical protein